MRYFHSDRLILEIQKIKDERESLESQAASQSRKRKRPNYQTDLLRLPKQAQKTFSSLGGFDCICFVTLLMIALPTLFHCIQVLLSTGTSSDEIIAGSHTLSVSFVSHFKQQLNSNLPNECIRDPTDAIQYIFILLTKLYSSSKLTTAQRCIMGDIIIDLVKTSLGIITDTTNMLITSILKNGLVPPDFREAIARGIHSICLVSPRASPLRQSLLLCLFLEFGSTWRSTREEKEKILCRTEILTYIHYIIEIVVEKTGSVKDISKGEVKKLVQEVAGSCGLEGMQLNNILAWKVCGLICGIEGVNALLQI
jgi:hypothetical protein